MTYDAGKGPLDRYLCLRTLHALRVIDLAMVDGLRDQADVAIYPKMGFSVRFFFS
jgi:hypothetical protein